MIWFFVTAVSYFLNAIAALVDKILLKKLIPEPVVYAFYVSVFGILALFFAPFDFRLPTLLILFLGLAAGVLFTFGLVLFYGAIKKGEVSRVTAAIGGVSSVFIFILAWLILGEGLAVRQILAFFIILFGSYFIAIESKKNREAFRSKLILMIFAAALLFAVSHVLTKFIYVNHSFAGGFVFRGLGSFLGGLLLLTFPGNLRKIKESFRGQKVERGAIFFIGQICAALAFILLNFAFSLGSVALISALAGVQYFFLFALAIIFSKYFKQILKEKMTPRIIFEKMASLILISFGAFLLFL